MNKDINSSPLVVGVDIGGTHITAALVNLDSGEFLPESWVRKEVDSDGEADQIIRAWSQVILEVLDGNPLTSKKIGIGMPGPLDYENGISLIKNQGKFDSLYGLNLKELLCNHLPIKVEDIRFMNDAGSFLRGEVFGGAAKGYPCAIGLTLGTGLGTACYKNGIAEDAALWQHPFKDGVAEDYLCTRWFIKYYEELSGYRVRGVKKLMERALVDGKAKKVFQEFGKNLAHFLNFFIEKDKPEVIVLGGNITNAYDFFGHELEKRLNGNGQQVPLLKAILGEKASLIGAASCWKKLAIQKYVK